MAHFAQLDNNIVQQVIVVANEDCGGGVFPESEAVGQAFIASLGLAGVWKQTSYNTRGGIYYDPETGEPSEDQSKALRKNYAGIGFTYDAERDAFIPPKPFESWVLNEETCLWDAPLPYPEDGASYYWNEELFSWELAEVE